MSPVVLLGHMDTVRGYIPVKLEDGVLFGRGAVDAKGPLAAFLCATARLVRHGAVGALRRPIVVIGAVEEEVGHVTRGACSGGTLSALCLYYRRTEWKLGGDDWL